MLPLCIRTNVIVFRCTLLEIGLYLYLCVSQYIAGGMNLYLCELLPVIIYHCH